MGQPLRVMTGSPLITQPLTIVIYWGPRKGPDALSNGHSALIIDSAAFDVFSSDFYVSWLGQAAGKNPFVRQADQATYYQDTTQWGGFPVGNNGNNRVPTRWVALQGLNIDAMKQEWDTIRTKQNAHWKLMDKNCATTVARVLKSGGSDASATSAQSQMVWWPTDLIRYARSMGNSVHSTS